ncbi:MAG: hypothetical protein Ct9H300mP14_05650 [Gammaproteobacteria bacterium]|nr:MAG: hypothetical protein Ct9H300mP14_05650 [Gammaproteobacteria bacterium]
MAFDDLTVFTGNANPELAREVAGHLGFGLGRALVSTFSDGEVNVEIMEHVGQVTYLSSSRPVHQPEAP